MPMRIKGNMVMCVIFFRSELMNDPDRYTYIKLFGYMIKMFCGLKCIQGKSKFNLYLEFGYLLAWFDICWLIL